MILRPTTVGALAAICALCAATPEVLVAGELPPGMSFVARDKAGLWGLYRADERHLAVKVATQFEPRQACVTPDGSRAVYLAADGTLRSVSPAREPQEVVLVAPTPQRAYAQPCLSADGLEIYAVEMADGRSVNTEVIRFSAGAAGWSEPVRLAPQPGAQHDPHVHQKRRLVYANVGCSNGCDELLVEIWARDFITGKTRQLSLLNALSQGPVTDGRRVVFSSNASGTHQLWQVGWDGSGQHQITEIPGQALRPALCGDGLFFLHVTPGKSTISHLLGDGTIEEIPVPGLNSFRALRCVQ